MRVHDEHLPDLDSTARERLRVSYLPLLQATAPGSISLEHNRESFWLLRVDLRLAVRSCVQSQSFIDPI